MKLERALRTIAVLSITTGMVVFLSIGYVWLKSRIVLAQAVPVQIPIVAPAPTPRPTLVTGRPTQLSIPSLELNLPVVDGAYNPNNGEWTLSPDKLHYALPTSLPNNESGNTLIYGHNKKGVFLTLHNIAPGSEAYIMTDNGYRFVYKFSSTEPVHPTNTDVFTYQGPARLTLQTCSGRFMQNRQLYYFTYDRYEKII